MMEEYTFIGGPRDGRREQHSLPSKAVEIRCVEIDRPDSGPWIEYVYKIDHTLKTFTYQYEHDMNS